MSDRPSRRLTVAVGFDGVLHQCVTYNYPFDPAKVLDPPVPGMLPWLIGLVHDSRFRVVIFSSRNGRPGGIGAMTEWLIDNGVSDEVLSQIDFPLQKPTAHVMISDRVLQFTGRPIDTDEILEFRPWNRA